MLPENVSTRPAPKPRGRPPGTTKNKKVATDSVLDPNGREKTDGRENVAQAVEKPIEQPKTVEISQNERASSFDVGKIYDSIKISDGKNEIAIVMFKKTNNTYGVKIMLNDQTEIRPVTYNGYNPAMSLWNLLKRSLN